MPFSAGVYTPEINFVTENASPPIEISKLDTQMDDLATALSNCILRDGTGLPTATIDMNAQALSNAGAITGARLIVTGATVPANGVYLSAANTVAVASNTTLRLSVNSTGNWVMAAPSSGTSLVVSSASGPDGEVISIKAATDSRVYWYAGATAYGIIQATANKFNFAATGAAATVAISTNGSERITVSAAGAVVINTPTAGSVGLVVSATGAVAGSFYTTNAEVIRCDSNASSPILGLFRSGARKGYINWDSSAGLLLVQEENLPVILYTNGAARLNIAAGGNVTINAPASGVPLSVSDGSSGVPAVGFTSDPDTGFYRSGANSMILMAGGVRCFAATGAAGDATVGNSSSSVVTINAAIQTTAVTGIADSLPSFPVGYLTISVNGSPMVIPYYNVS